MIYKGFLGDQTIVALTLEISSQMQVLDKLLQNTINKCSTEKSSRFVGGGLPKSEIK
jgi:hypothetical protein